MKFSGSVKGIAILKGNFGKIEKIGDKPNLKKLGILMQKSTIKTFETEGVNLLGHKWKDLKEKTKEARKKRGHWTGRILTEIGHLVGSITYEVPKPRVLQWGVDTTGSYGVYHQSTKPRKRTKAGKIKLPRRQFLGTSDKDIKMIENTLGKGIMKRISMEIRG
ncbi:phage virion morphogenesis protein [candidate division WOR-3 bacterium]|nr:phage virion morphogenesis protein [candidate division WOR-3 bacterium]